jgi:hypothetical protein
MKKNAVILLCIVIFIALFILPSPSETESNEPVAAPENSKKAEIQKTFKVNILAKKEDQDVEGDSKEVPQVQFEFNTQQTHIDWFLGNSLVLATMSNNRLAQLNRHYEVNFNHRVVLSNYVVRSLNRVKSSVLTQAGVKNVHLLWPKRSFSQLMSHLKTLGLHRSIVRIEKYGQGYLILRPRNSVSSEQIASVGYQSIRINF